MNAVSYVKNVAEKIIRNIQCGETCEVFGLGVAVLSLTKRLETVSNALLPNR
jgi:hypothetical protein